MPANCAIDFVASGFTTHGERLMGMHAANESFLNGFLRHAKVGTFHCHTRSRAEFDAFLAATADQRPAGTPVVRIAADDTAALAQVGALLHPFPGFGPLAWVRRRGDARAYSLLGITHTTATPAVMTSIGDLLIAPIEPWDAVVCTSRAVHRTYEIVLDHWSDYLKLRLGARRVTLPRLPIIPLGVDADAFAANTEARARWRRRHGIGDKDIAVLWVGRFNHQAKTHPMPAYRALQEAASAVDGRVFYLQAGWFPDEKTEKAFKDAAKGLAPAVRHVFLDGRDPSVRREAWHAADLFLSLSDNVQETFGLTPVEAMAAGLPVVASDWDGYRDTVRHGVDGLLVPTLAPAPGMGEDIAHAFAAGVLPFSGYSGVTCQATAVDLTACVEALRALCADSGLRARLGANGRERARSAFDWSVVIGQYQELLAELADVRAHAAESTCPKPAHRPAAPLCADPYDVFGDYATGWLTPATRLERTRWAHEPDLAATARHPLNGYALPWLLPPETLKAVLARVEAEPGIRLEALLAAHAGEDAAALTRGVGWLIKHGYLRASG